MSLISLLEPIKWPGYVLLTVMEDVQESYQKHKASWAWTQNWGTNLSYLILLAQASHMAELKFKQ